MFNVTISARAMRRRCLLLYDISPALMPSTRQKNGAYGEYTSTSRLSGRGRRRRWRARTAARRHLRLQLHYASNAAVRARAT